MLDNFFVRKDSLENVVKDNKVTGFRFAVQACNYRGCFLSLVNGYYVKCDGVEYPQEAQRFQVNGKEPRTYEEIKRTGIWEHWNFGDEAYIYVEKEGGLTPGKHELSVQECILTQYGYAKWDEEWVTNPPKPGTGAVGKVAKPSLFVLEVQ
ncbi:MAG: DUF6379 domain-containing protein [Oliverpabstia sp.]